MFNIKRNVVHKKGFSLRMENVDNKRTTISPPFRFSVLIRKVGKNTRWYQYNDQNTCSYLQKAVANYYLWTVRGQRETTTD